MKQTIIIGFVILTIILVSGCVGSGRQTQLAGKPFISGTEELRFGFVDLPASTLVDTPFTIAIVAENAGATDVAAGQLKLDLNDAATFGLTAQSHKENTDPLIARKVIGGNLINGTFERIEFGDAQFVGITPLKEERRPLLIDACYPYKERLQADLCIDSGKGRVCKPADPEKFDTSSAKVQITNYEQTVSLVRSGSADVVFSFNIKNVGSGDTYIGSSCANLKSEDRGFVQITGFSFAGMQNAYANLKCSKAKEKLPVTKGEGTKITCRLTGIPAANDFKDVMTLTVSYVYKTLIKGSITIVPTGLEERQENLPI